MNPGRELLAHGQSCWLDDLTRRMIESGELARRVADGELLGITSNPSTFAKSVKQGNGYDRDIAAAAAGQSPEQIYETLAVTDVRNACDILRPAYDRTGGKDGFVSLEVSPRLAHDTKASIEEARRLWSRVDRPNLFVKIPGTAAGVPAIEELLFEGVNVNITLLFSIRRYEEVAEAYVHALERRLERDQPIDRIASVASFFLSRIDTLVDKLLEQRLVPGKPPGDPDPRRLLGRIAVANAKLAYQLFKQRLASNRWWQLERRGAQAQRLLWASTSTKNPAYPDLMYVEPLVGPLTINTMPEKTIAAFRDHARIRSNTVSEGIEEAQRLLSDLERLGVSLDRVTAELESEGIRKFIEAFDALLGQLRDKRQGSRNVTQRETRASP